MDDEYYIIAKPENLYLMKAYIAYVESIPSLRSQSIPATWRPGSVPNADGSRSQYHLR